MPTGIPSAILALKLEEARRISSPRNLSDQLQSVWSTSPLTMYFLLLRLA